MTPKERRLLVIDDEPDICSFVSAFFQTRGVSVYQAYDGEEAVKISQEKRPHLILLDVKMKSDDEGFVVLPKLRKMLPQTQIILVTGVEDAASVLRGKALGADDYITKPLILSHLESVVLSRMETIP